MYLNSFFKFTNFLILTNLYRKKVMLRKKISWVKFLQNPRDPVATFKN